MEEGLSKKQHPETVEEITGMSRADLDTVDAILQQHVKGVVDEVRSELGDRLSAVILRGSLAMGTFYAQPGKEEASIGQSRTCRAN